jgi:hypothetical protein
MKSLVDSLIANGMVPEGVPAWIAYLGAMLLFGGIVVFVFVLPIAGITTWVERRIAGRIQSRIGPNRTGPAGFLQWLADGIKSVLKEASRRTSCRGRPTRRCSSWRPTSSRSGSSPRSRPSRSRGRSSSQT